MMAYVLLYHGSDCKGIHFDDLEKALKFVRGIGPNPWVWWKIMNPVTGVIMVTQR